MSNPHAEQIQQYCRDWQETVEPWKRWMMQTQADTAWLPCAGHPSWCPEFRYRRKPDTILVNGIECVAPLRVAPPPETKYWVLDLYAPGEFMWVGDEVDLEYLAAGHVFATEEDAAAMQLAMTAPLRAYVAGEKS